MPQIVNARWIAAVSGEVHVWCKNTACRHNKSVSLLSLRVSGRFDQPMAQMVFRCEKCGGRGYPVVTWRDIEGHWSLDVLSGEKTPVARLPNFYRQ